MRISRMGKRISVQGVPIDTTLFCPYCCATVDTAFTTLRGTRSRTRTTAPSPASIGYYRSPLSLRDVCIGAQTQRDVCGLHGVPRYPC